MNLIKCLSLWQMVFKTLILFLKVFEVRVFFSIC